MLRSGCGPYRRARWSLSLLRTCDLSADSRNCAFFFLVGGKGRVGISVGGVHLDSPCRFVTLSPPRRRLIPNSVPVSGGGLTGFPHDRGRSRSVSRSQR